MGSSKSKPVGNIVCIGLDNAGKSTIINYLKADKEKVRRLLCRCFILMPYYPYITGFTIGCGASTYGWSIYGKVSRERLSLYLL